MSFCNKPFPANQVHEQSVASNGSLIAVRTPLFIGGRWGVVRNQIDPGKTGEADFQGNFTFNKAAGGGTAIAKDAWLCFKDATDLGTKTLSAWTPSVGAIPVGRAVRAAVDADTTIQCRLEAPPNPMVRSFTVVTGTTQVIATGLSVAPTKVLSVQITSTGNVRRAPAGAVTLPGGGSAGSVSVVDAGFAANEVVDIVYMI